VRFANSLIINCWPNMTVKCHKGRNKAIKIPNTKIPTHPYKMAIFPVEIPSNPYKSLKEIFTYQWQHCAHGQRAVALTGISHWVKILIPEVWMDWIIWTRTPAASNRIRSEVIFPVAGSGWIWIFLLKKRYWFFAWLIFSRTQAGVGLLESSWYRIRLGFGFTICKTGLDPDSKKSESDHLYLKPDSYCCDRKSRAACAQSFAPWQQATIEIMLAISLTIACSCYTYDGVILHAHPVRGESNN